MIYIDKYKKYNNGKFYYQTLEYLEGDISYLKWNEVLSLNESTMTYDIFVSKFTEVFTAIQSKFTSGIKKLSDRIINILKTFYGLAIKFFSKHKKILVILSLIVLLIIVTSASSYAATTGNPPPTEFINAALGYLDLKGPQINEMLSHSEHIKGNPESYINMTKALLTQMRDGGNIAISDDKEFLKTSQGLANGAIELVKSMKTSKDPSEQKIFIMLVDMGEKLSSTFSRNITMMGGK
jgi:hypothetical protein